MPISPNKVLYTCISFSVTPSKITPFIVYKPLTTKFFNTSIYENNPYNYTSGQIKEESLYPFTNLYIKKSYIQDNIKQISIKPISLYDSIYKANIDNILSNIDIYLNIG